MRVVVLTRQASSQAALCHKLAAVGDLVAIVLSENVPRKRPARGLQQFMNRVAARTIGFPFISAWQALHADYRRRWPSFPVVPQFRVENVNDSTTEQVLRHYRPDLVMVSGTNLVGKRLIELAQRGIGMLNLHTGLSPYVKGGPNCTNWCLADNTFHLIGNTVMWIDPGIDTGALVLTEQTPLTGRESLYDLHLSVMEHAHDIYVRAATAVGAGLTVPRVPQRSVATGRTYYSAEWDGRAMARGWVNYKRRYCPEYFHSLDHLKQTAELRLVALNDGT